MAPRKPKGLDFDVEWWPVTKPIPYENNPRFHSDRAVEIVANSIRTYGWQQCVLVDKEGVLVAGHNRLKAAKLLGEKWVPVKVAHNLTPEQIRAYRIADNRTAEESEWDDDKLAFEMLELSALDFDMEQLGFTSDELAKYMETDFGGLGGDGETEGQREARVHQTLAARFIIPPFSVLDARQGYWQERKKAWVDRGIQSEMGRGDVLFDSKAQNRLKEIMNEGKDKSGGVLMASNTSADPGFYAKKRAKEKELGVVLTTEEFTEKYYDPNPEGWTSGTSIFDPVLCELAYRWFSPEGGTILDPFAGGSVRGVVAAWLGREYVGIDLRPEQCEANHGQLEDMGDVPGAADWFAGDSAQMDKILPAKFAADFVFTCPPYGDLEVYSDDAADLSNMSADDFRAAYRDILYLAVERLKPDRFACVVVGDYRDKAGFYQNFVSHTIECMEEAGAKLYNDAILVTMVGSLPIRTGRQFEAGRKLGKTHQNVLVFCKGDPAKAVAALGAVEYGAGEGSQAAPEAAAGAENALTPVEKHGEYWLKRDDLFNVAGVQGGKVRTCWHLSQGAEGLVTAGSRASPQVNIVAHIAKSLGIPCRCHTPEGELSPEVEAAQRMGAEIIQHKAGYNSVIIARAREDAEARGWTEIPFGMECEEAPRQTMGQVANLPADASRLVVPVGSGMSLAGILWGLQETENDIPVLGVVVGADPEKRLDTYAPPGWRERVTLVKAEADYHADVEATIGDVWLDPHYEGKCAAYMEPGDCLWIVGIRQTETDIDDSEWTYGAEIEMSDFDRSAGKCPAGLYVTSEVGSVNSDGLACWWQNPLGGEVNTHPTSSPGEQFEIFERFLAAFPDATSNYRSTTHAHIAVPGLRDDLPKLKRLLAYSQRWTPWVIDKVYCIERTPEFDALPYAGKVWRYLNVGCVMPPEWRVDQIMGAETVDDFFRNHMLNKDGKHTPLQATRYAVNFLMLDKHGTIEFRHFLGAYAADHVRTVCEYAREFVRAALVTGEPMPDIFRRCDHWEFPPPVVVDAELEKGYQASKLKDQGRSTPKYILLGEKVGAGSADKEWAA